MGKVCVWGGGSFCVLERVVPACLCVCVVIE